MTAPLSIAVTPLVGEFSDVECGKVFVIPFTVRNVSSRVCRIRCIPPASKCFRLLSTQQSIAPGMKQVVELEFSSPTPGEVHDQLIIRCDDGDVTIPVHAWFPTPNIQFPPNVDFGQVSKNHPVESKKLKLRNNGRKDGVFKFVCEGATSGVSITPAQGIVPAGRDIDVAVHLFPTEAGSIRSAFLMHVEGVPTARSLSVCAEVIEARVLIVRPNTFQPVSQVNFGKLYYGQKREMQLLVKNTGQSSVSFSIASPETEAEEDLVAAPYPIQVIPREGRIARNGTALLTFKFAPQMLEQKQGWEHAVVDEKSLTRSWDFPFELDILETEEKIELQMTGTAVPTIVKVSEKLCRFGECPANSFVDMCVTLENLNHDLPVLFELNRVAHFTANPSRGVVSPQSSNELRLSFQPKQLGSFEGRFVISLNGGIKKIPIMVNGTSSSIGAKPPKASGIDAIKEDFQRSPNYNKNMVAAAKAPAIAHAAETDVLLRPEHEQKLQHNRLYNQFLANSRAIREVRRDASHHKQENPDDLGMIPAEGLEPPEPELPRHVDRLPWPTNADGKLFAQADHPATHKLKIDENRLIKKKFRRDPSNLNEMRECKLVLSPKDIQNIVIPVKLIDFQRVSVFSLNKKPFFVHNGLKTHIHVAIAFSREELSQSSPNAQVVPPGQTAGFDVTFCSEVAQTFQQAIYFTINDAHKLKFVVLAEAVPVELSMSHADLSFRFPDFGQDMSVSQTMAVTNPGNSDANFSWTCADSAFSFHPASGTVAPSATMPISVTYAPPLGVNESKADAHLKVVGGQEPKRLLLTGSVPAATCSWSLKESRVDFKKVAVGMIRSQVVTLKNTSSVATVYAFDVGILMPGVSLSQVRGRIGPGGSEDVTIQLKCPLPQALRCNLHCHVRGMRQLLRAVVSAEAKIPDMTILEPAEGEDDPAIDFGDVYVGSSEHRRLTIQNHDDIPATLVLDLREFPQFSLSDSERRPVQSGVPDDDTDLPVEGAGGVHIVRPEDADEAYESATADEGKLYRITINPKETFTFYVVFTPTEVADVEFQLPLALAGCDVVSDALRPLIVAAVGKRPKLVISPTVVDFGARVVVRDGTSKIPNRVLVRLSNETDAPLLWELDGRRDGGDVFRVEPASGKLLPGQGSQLQVTFVPSEIRSYAARYTMFLDGNRESKYMDIHVKGFGSNPGLLFDRKEVILPPVPLETLSVGTFFIGNDGYESMELKYRIAGDGKLPVTLKFPEGNLVTSSTSMIPVEVHFLSKKPMTFTVNIDFYDDMDGLFSIPVTCTADNSVVTCFGYIKATESVSSLTSESDRKPVMYRDLTKTLPRGEPAAEDDATAAYTLIDTVLRRSITQRQLDRIRQWLNSNVLPDPVDDLIGSLQLNQGKLFLDIVEMLYGKVPQLPKVPGRENTGTTALALIDPFDSALLFLKQFGACVSDVRSEYLLKYEDFVKFAAAQDQQSHLRAQKHRARTSRISERRFGARSLHAWLTVLAQTVRVFFFARIGWKTLRNLPASPATGVFALADKWATTADPSCSGSNVYSTPEAVLLRWLSVHLSYFFSKNAGKDFDAERDRMRVMNFTTDLRDSRAFAACVMAYIPSAASRLDPNRDFGIVAAPAGEDDIERNATILLDTLQEFGLDPRISPHELVEGSALDNVLFTSFLFNALPQYVPKTTIKFKGKLLEKITRQIELTNPTKWPIDYTVSIDGCDEFKIAETKIHLEPKATTSFAISITPRFSKKVGALCMFLSNRGSATMVFQLDTEVDPESSMKTFEGIEAHLYDPINYDVMVENPFPTAAQFSVHVQQEYVKGEKPMPEEESLLHFPEAFWPSTDTISIKKSDKAKFTLQFLPCIRGTYRARIVFRDDRAGEFAYKFVATGLPPRPFDTITLQTEAANAVTHEVAIPLRHTALEKALAQRVERLKGLKGSKKAATKDGEVDGRDTLYKVEFLNEKFVGPNPFFTGPKSFYLLRPGEERSNRVPKAVAQGQSFALSFNPRTPGTYSAILLLSSPWDVRAIAIDAKSRSPGMKAELDFHCPARQQIVQDIPITNSSDSEWVVTATLQGEYFSGPREIRISPGKTKNYTLAFNPAWICDIMGQLVLKNSDTQEKYTYVLKGRADEPLAENTIPVECRARESRKISVTVPNITFDDVVYQVVTDLPFVSGETSLPVQKMDVGRYALTINPQLNGKVTGSLTFVAPNKQYVWFVVQVTVSRPPPEDTIAISAEVRTGAVAEITINNPKDKRVDFLVRRKGDGLFGDDLLTIEPREAAVYQLAYAPTRACEGEGVVSFNNDEIGEFWYKLKLTAVPAAPADLSFQCEIGRSVSEEIVLQNPTASDCSMTVNSTNETNFSVTPATLMMRAGSTLRATITYTPSAIQLSQEGTIFIAHPKAGQWEYRCRGMGTPPTKMDPVRCIGQVNGTGSLIVSFRNPFPFPRRFIPNLSSPSGVFALMQKRVPVTLSPFQAHQIPISYAPTDIAQHDGLVVVEAVDQQEGAALRWEFPIEGTAEAFSTSGSIKFSCKSRKESTTTLPLTLAHLHVPASQEDMLPTVVVDAASKHHAAAASAIAVVRVESPPGSDPDVVHCQFTFAPLRPFVAAAELLLRRRGGGMWRFPMSLEAQAPEVDDIIELEAAVNVVASATFQLYNVLPQSCPYHAYFTPDSPQEFSVTPAMGTLPAMPRNASEAVGAGTTLTVNFASTQYGKTLVGHLLVDTDQMQWRYEVRGSLPKYRPPTKVQSRVAAYTRGAGTADESKPTERRTKTAR